MLADYIRFRFPSAVPGVDYQLRDDGNGPLIEHWNEALGPMPTQADIDAAASDVARFVASAEVLAQIDVLERTSLLNRGSRELELQLMEQQAAPLASEAGVTPEQFLSTVPYYVKLKALDDQIRALRAQL